MLVFAKPLWLFILPPLFYLLWRLQKRSLTPATLGLRRIWFAVRCVVLLLVVLALAELQWEIQVRRNETLFLVDISASIRTDQRKQEIEALNRIMEKIHPPDLAGVILFGENSAIERFPTNPFPVEKTEAEISERTTNLEKAARLAGSTFSSNAQKSLVLLSDGEDNQGQPEREFLMLKSDGVSLQSLYFPPIEKPEASLSRVRFPEPIHLNEPFDIEVLTESNRRQPAVLQLFRNGTLLQEATVLLQASGKQLFRLPEKLQERGLYHYEIKLKAEQDFRSENNTEDRKSVV